MCIRIIQHPLAKGVLTVSRNGALVPCVNGTSIQALHAMFRKLVVIMVIRNRTLTT